MTISQPGDSESGAGVAGNIAVVRELIERGFNAGELEVVDRLVAPEFVEHQPLAPGVSPTREATRAIITALRSGFGEFRLSIEEIDAVEDRVWMRMRASGLHHGEFMGHAPTGRRVEIDVIDVVRLRRGRIVEHWGVPDQLSLLGQIEDSPIP
jgi:predicted ester cyclase